MISPNEILLSTLPITAGTALKLVQDDITDGFYIDGIKDTAQIIVSDLHCRVLIKKTILNKELVSISPLRKGIYIVRIITATDMVEKKLVKY